MDPVRGLARDEVASPKDLGGATSNGMDREDTLKFTNSVILLSKLLTKTEDKFLARKLYEKIINFTLSFLDHKRKNVAQYSHSNLINSVNNLLDYLEYLAHISKNATPLLIAQRNLLKFKLYVLKQDEQDRDRKAREFSKIPVSPDVSIPTEAPVSKLNPKTKSIRPIPKSNSTKERILNFVRKFPDVRTKEIIDEFNVLSGRTVKRNLRELIDEGFLKKKSEGGAVHYLVSNL